MKPICGMSYSMTYLTQENLHENDILENILKPKVIADMSSVELSMDVEHQCFIH